MTLLENRLIEKAKKRHGRILPVRGWRHHDKRSFKTDIMPDGKVHVSFWYNSIDNSTHIISEVLDN